MISCGFFISDAVFIDGRSFPFRSRWVNRKDPRGKNIFSGGFLGLDNIGIFDRSKPLPIHGELEQVRSTPSMDIQTRTWVIAVVLNRSFE